MARPHAETKRWIVLALVPIPVLSIFSLLLASWFSDFWKESIFESAFSAYTITGYAIFQLVGVIVVAVENRQKGIKWKDFVKTTLTFFITPKFYIPCAGAYIVFIITLIVTVANKTRALKDDISKERKNSIRIIAENDRLRKPQTNWLESIDTKRLDDAQKKLDETRKELSDIKARVAAAISNLVPSRVSRRLTEDDIARIRGHITNLGNSATIHIRSYHGVHGSEYMIRDTQRAFTNGGWVVVLNDYSFPASFLIDGVTVTLPKGQFATVEMGAFEALEAGLEVPFRYITNNALPNRIILMDFSRLSHTDRKEGVRLPSPP
jgi:hypothetical protein